MIQFLISYGCTEWDKERLDRLQINAGKHPSQTGNALYTKRTIQNVNSQDKHEFKAQNTNGQCTDLLNGIKVSVFGL